MIFPFSLNFNESLKTPINPEDKESVLQYIEESILEDKADNVVIGDMQVSYKGSISVWRGSLYRGVDNGVFTLINDSNKWMIHYQINMRQLFITTSIMATVMGIFAVVNDGPWWIGFAAFLWLCGANWITNLIRHGIVAAEIAVGIDEMIRSQRQLIEHNENEI